MSFVVNNKIYNLLIKGWFKTKGRSSRQEYILRFVMMWFSLFLCNITSKFFHAINENTVMLLFSVFLLFICVVLLALSVIQVFFVTHRRLHDLNASGWWQLITLIPMGQLLMIGLIFFKGTPTTNKYGEPPSY